MRLCLLRHVLACLWGMRILRLLGMNPTLSIVTRKANQTMKTRKALPYVLACSAVTLWTGDLTAQVPSGVRGPIGPVIPELLRHDLQTLNLPATEQEPFTAEVRLGDQMQTLVLDPYTMRADDFRVLVQGEDGQLREVEPPPPRTYRGTVQGEPLSRVSATLMDGQLWAVVALESGQVWYIQPLSELAVGGGPNASHVIYRGEDVVPVDGVCGVDDLPQPLGDPGDRRLGGDPIATGTGLQTTDIAFDADWEFYLANGSSVPLTVADIENVMNKVELVYERDTDITYEITVMVIRTANNDPYSSTDPGTLLNQFRDTWRTTPEVFIRRDTAQLFTGKNLNGGSSVSPGPGRSATAPAVSATASWNPGSISTLIFVRRCRHMSWGTAGMRGIAARLRLDAPRSVIAGSCVRAWAAAAACLGQI